MIYRLNVFFDVRSFEPSNLRLYEKWPWKTRVCIEGEWILYAIFPSCANLTARFPYMQ